MTIRHPAPTGWSRRDVLRGSAAALLGAYGFAPRYGLAADIPLEYDGSKFQMAAPEPNPKHGGVLRYGILNRPPHFDVHQSGTVGNIGTQGCMFDNLIRRDPRDSGKSIVPDLAHSWEIAKDGKTYAFHLRQGVQFHDGTDFTSADVKATFDRIAKPPAGISIPRTPLFRAVSEINARDKYTVEFKLSAPRSINFMMSAFASGWNVIFSKKTLEENNFDLRKVLNIPGTGPFKTQRRVENEIWVMERNPNYWNKGLPYLDGFEVYNLLPFSPELGSAILSGRVDYARALDPVTARKAATIPGLSTAKFYQSVIHATWVNAKRKPLDDPRVRRALHLLCEKQVLVDVVKDVSPLMTGGFIYPFSEFATPKDQLVKRVGYQDDPGTAIKEAKALLAAAGQTSMRPLDFMVRDLNHHKLFGQAIQAMLKEVGIQSDLRWWSNRCGSATRPPATTTWPSAPSSRRSSTRPITSTPGTAPMARRTTRSGTTPNLTSWSTRSTSKSMPSKRLALIRRAEDLMEMDPPLVPVAWENILDVWYNYVKGHNPKDYFGIYDVVRFDTFWLDKA